MVLAVSLAALMVGSAGSAELKPCSPGKLGPALCARFPVFEDRDAATGRVIHLNVLYFPSRASGRVDAAVVMSGGPGEGSASQASIFYTRQQLDHIRLRHAVLFVDSRGTGESDAIDCPIKPRTAQAFFDIGMVDLETLASCRAKIAQQADIRWYNTNAIADDLDDVRAALHFDMLTLVGFSGGTRDAEVYTRRHPNHVRAMFLAGVNSPHFKLPLPFARARQVALDAVFAQCESEKLCHRVFPFVSVEFNVVLRRIRARSASLNVALGHYPKQAVALTYPIFAERLGTMLYDPANISRIPYIVHAAYLRDWLPFYRAAYASAPYFLAGAPLGVSRGYYLSSTCSEDVPFITSTELKRETEHTFALDTRYRLQKAYCKVWDVPPVDPTFLEPIKTSVPTLMYSDRFDPATPWWIGRSDLPGFTNGRQIIANYFGHLFEDCVITMSLRFIDTANTHDVDEGCAAVPLHQSFVVGPAK